MYIALKYQKRKDWLIIWFVSPASHFIKILECYYSWIKTLVREWQDRSKCSHIIIMRQ